MLKSIFEKMDFITKEFITNYNPNNTITENYKPLNINTVISHNKLKKYLKVCIENNDFPNILLHGLPGIGKTCLINACINELFDNKDYNVISINASERRGDSMLKELLINFLDNESTFTNNKLKIVILDEMDNLTKDGQNLIKTLIDTYKNVRFVLICNYENKVDESLKCRCLYYKLIKPNKDEIKKNIEKILIFENINISTLALDKIFDYSNNDIRKILNILQCLKIVYKSKPIFENNVIKYLNITKKEEVKMLCDKLKTQPIGDFIKDFDIYQYPDLIHLLYDIYDNTELTPKQIIGLSDLEIMVYEGISYTNFYYFLSSLFKL